VDEDSHEVELRGGGWSGPIGRVEEYNLGKVRTFKNGLMPEVGEEPLFWWDCLQITELFLSQPAALLVAQGMQLRELFPDSGYFITRPGNIVFSNGPYIFLAGKLTPPNDPPLRLKGVVLAHVTNAPEGMPMEKLLGLLLTHVLDR
jgi:hypothetical protein